MTLQFRLLRADEINVRVARASERGAQYLLYKDARCDMDILDETVGPLNWQRVHSRDNANCTILIFDPDKGEWVGKEDTGTESQTEAEKGLASDSFKRAATNWGIGRELYTSPFIWVSGCTEKDSKGRFVPKREFANLCVTDIQYNGRNIVGLTICSSNGQTVFTFGQQPKTATKTATKAKLITQEQIDFLLAVYQGANLEKLLQKNGLSRIEDMTSAKADALIDKLNEKVGSSAS